MFFGYALALELAADEDKFELTSEYEPSKHPFRIDYVLKLNNPHERLQNPIARHFRMYNLFEYKRSGQSFTYMDYLKTLAYAGLYANQKHMKHKENQITLNIVTDKCETKFFRTLYTNQCKVTKFQEGIYQIADSHFPVQLILRIELSKENNLYLRDLGRDIGREEIKPVVRGCYNTNSHLEQREAYLKFLFEQNTDILEEVFQMMNEKVIDYEPNFPPSFRATLLELVTKFPEGKKFQEETFELGLERGIEQGRMREKEAMILFFLGILDDETIATRTGVSLEKIKQMRAAHQKTT